MKNIRTLLLLILLLVTGLLSPSGCGDGGTPIPGPLGLLYVLDRVNDAVYILENIATLNGPNAPVRTLAGTNTLIQSPTAIADDNVRDILYIADTTAQAVLAFLPASNVEGDTGPLRIYPGLAKASSFFLDVVNNRLYAGDTVANAIQVWDGIGSLLSGTTPTRSIPLGYEPTGVFVDTDRDLLYVGDPSTFSVNVYNNASTLGIFSPPDATIIDFTQAFVNINSLTMNPANNILFVAESANPSIEIFDDASTLNGAEATDRELQGSTTTLSTHLGQILFLNNILYVNLSDISNSIGVWESANTVNNDTAPTRSIQVTGAAEIIGFAVDLSH